MENNNLNQPKNKLQTMIEKVGSLLTEQDLLEYFIDLHIYKKIDKENKKKREDLIKQRVSINENNQTEINRYLEDCDNFGAFTTRINEEGICVKVYPNGFERINLVELTSIWPNRELMNESIKGHLKVKK